MVFSPKGREAKWKTQVDNTAKNSTLGGRAVVTKAVISLQDLRARGKAESSWRSWGLYRHVGVLQSGSFIVGGSAKRLMPGSGSGCCCILTYVTQLMKRSTKPRESQNVAFLQLLLRAAVLAFIAHHCLPPGILFLETQDFSRRPALQNRILHPFYRLRNSMNLRTPPGCYALLRCHSVHVGVAKKERK